MKRNLILVANILSMCILFILQLSEYCSASITSTGRDCEVCHGLYKGMMEEVEPGKPQYVLKNVLCVNCHSNSDRDTIKKLGSIRVPVVYNTAVPHRLLAGGNFHYVAKDFGDRKGHNIDGITSMDAKFRGVPPGYERTSDPSAVGYDPKRPLVCAGSNGCHGNRDIEDPFVSILGSHHKDDSKIEGNTTAKSYRFLRNAGNVDGVLGLEDDEWNQNSSSKKHNEYSPSIDLLCASCHGVFHSREKTGKERPWFRHPTDILLPKIGEYMNYRVHNPDAPVGRVKILGSPSEEVIPGEDVVICLSCHVAHASPYNSILRWDYDAIVAGEAIKGGCFICHTEKGE